MAGGMAMSRAGSRRLPFSPAARALRARSDPSSVHLSNPSPLPPRSPPPVVRAAPACRERMREAIFNANVAKINDHNGKGHPWTMGVNKVHATAWLD